MNGIANIAKSANIANIEMIGQANVCEPAVNFGNVGNAMLS
jgi:hypothetical protein